MSTFYIDLVNGVDGNNGVDWAHAGKTLWNAWNFWDVQPGDLIKVSKTPDPSSLGINATWTDNNKLITLASSLTKNIEMCENAWNVAANVSQADETYYFKEGTKSRKITPAAAFVTGKMAWKSFAAQNFSAYTKISFWIRVSSAFNVNNLRIALCSDANGDTIVNQANLGFYAYMTGWYPVVLNIGALGASIQSVALYADADPGTISIYLDDIIACNNFTLQSLIGKNTADDTFWPIRSINDTSVQVGNPQDNATYGLVYRGTSETRTIYQRPGFTDRFPMSSSDYWHDSPSHQGDDPVIEISGGWDPVSNTQNGITCFDGYIGQGEGIHLINVDKIKYTKFALVRWYYGFRGYSNDTGIELEDVECSFCGYYGIYAYATSPWQYDMDSWVLTNIKTFGNYSMGLYTSDCRKWSVDGFLGVNEYYAIDAYKNDYSSWKNITSKYNSSYGLLLQLSADCEVDGVTSNNGDGSGANFSSCQNIKVKNLNISNCTYDGVRFSSCSGAVVDTVTSINNAGSGIDITYTVNIKIKDLVTSGNTEGGISAGDSQVQLDNPLICETVKVLYYSGYAYGRDQFVSCRKFYQINNYHRIFNYSGKSQSEQFVRHTASGLAWALIPEHVIQKLRFPPNNFKYTVLANKLVTIDIYVRKSNLYNGNAPRLVLIGGILSGISSDVIDSLSVGADTWEQLQITGTPTEDGVLEFYVDCDGNAGQVYIDDIGVVQAA